MPRSSLAIGCFIGTGTLDWLTLVEYRNRNFLLLSEYGVGMCGNTHMNLHVVFAPFKGQGNYQAQGKRKLVRFCIVR